MNRAEDHLSVTRWIAELKDGDAEAARRVWELYYYRVLAVAQNKLGTYDRRVEDEEDVAARVFDTVFRGAADGHFPQLADRTDLWQLLVAVTTNKAIDGIRRENRQKRGGGRVRGDSIFGPNSEQRLAGFDGLVGDSDAPDLAVIFDEEFQKLLGLLRDDTLRDIVRWRIEGQTNAWIGQELQISEHAVGRKVRLIRMKWSEELAS